MDEKILKKHLKIIVKYIKSLRPDGIVLMSMDGSKFKTALIDSDYVQTLAAEVEFKDDITNEVARMLCKYSKFVFAKDLNRVLSGSKVSFNIIDGGIGNIVSSKGVWESTDNRDAHIKINDYYEEIKAFVSECTRNNSAYYYIDAEKFDKITSKFLGYDTFLIEDFNKAIRFTNRMFPNVDKDTSSLSIRYFNNADTSLSDDELEQDDYYAVLEIRTENDFCVTKMYYPFLLLYL